MKYIYVFLVAALVGIQLVTSAPLEERTDFFANIDANQVVGHFKDFMMYLPVLMTTIKETMTGFPKVAEGLNTLGSRRTLLGSSKNDGICRCKPNKSDAKSTETGYR